MFRLLGTLFYVATALIGFHLHHSLFFALVDFVLAPLVWVKWLLYHEVTVSIICDAFRWFFV